MPNIGLVVDNTKPAAPAKRRAGGLQELPTNSAVADEFSYQAPKGSSAAIVYQKHTVRVDVPDVDAANDLRMGRGSLRQYVATRTELGHETGFASGACIRQRGGSAVVVDGEGRQTTLKANVDVDQDDDGRPMVAIDDGGHLRQEIFLDGSTAITVRSQSRGSDSVTYHVAADGTARIEGSFSTVRGTVRETPDGRIAVLSAGDRPTLTVIKPFVRRSFLTAARIAAEPDASVQRLPLPPYQRKQTVREPDLSGRGVFKRITERVERLCPDASQADNLPMEVGDVQVFPSRDNVVETRITFQDEHTVCASGPLSADIADRQLTLKQGTFYQHINVDGHTRFEERSQTRAGDVASAQWAVQKNGAAAMRGAQSTGWTPLKLTVLPEGRLLLHTPHHGVTTVVEPLVALSHYLPV